MVNYSASGQAWQFSVDAAAYGAKGDGQVVADVATTNASKVITSASAAFTAADVGKHVMINGGGGTASPPLLDTIASVQSATQATLTTTAASVTTTGCAMVWGTDDTAAIQAAIDAAKTYATVAGTKAGSGDFYAEITFGPKIYLVAAAPVQATGPTYNTQLKIPYFDLTGAPRKLVLRFTGSGDGGHAQFWQSTAPNLAGTCLVSTQTAPSTADATFGVQSVIGGPSGGSSFTAGFANTHVHIDGISVWCPAFTNMKGWNLGFLAGATWGSFSANVFAPALQGTHPQLGDLPSLVAFQSTIGVGCIFPWIGNNDDVTGQRFAVEGYEIGFKAADHFTCPSVAAVYTDLAMEIDNTQGASGNSHLVSIPNFSAESYNGAILCTGGYATVDIGLDVETSGGADPAYDVKDQGANLHGTVRVTDNNGRVARRPVVVNCADLKVVNDMLGPGAWSGQPAVPATTVAQQNTSWRDAAVSIKGGTVTVVAVDGVTCATATNTTVIVPAGKNITLTYSVAPTWAWTLL